MKLANIEYISEPTYLLLKKSKCLQIWFEIFANTNCVQSHKIYRTMVFTYWKVQATGLFVYIRQRKFFSWIILEWNTHSPSSQVWVLFIMGWTQNFHFFSIKCVAKLFIFQGLQDYTIKTLFDLLHWKTFMKMKQMDVPNSSRQMT